jgi:hypothetical protein
VFSKTEELPPIGTVSELEKGRLSPLRPSSASRKALTDEEKHERDEERRKLFGGSDVFERLANAHTLASKAKVFTRVSSMDEGIREDAV